MLEVCGAAGLNIQAAQLSKCWPLMGVSILPADVYPFDSKQLRRQNINVKSSEASLMARPGWKSCLQVADIFLSRGVYDPPIRTVREVTGMG